MGLFGPSQTEMREATEQAIRNTLPEILAGLPLTVAVEIDDGLEVSQPETRPARGWQVVDKDMIGKELNPRPHALWANGPTVVTLEDDIGNKVPFRLNGHELPCSPKSIVEIEDPDVVVIALYP